MSDLRTLDLRTLGGIGVRSPVRPKYRTWLLLGTLHGTRIRKSSGEGGRELIFYGALYGLLHTPSELRRVHQSTT